MRVQHSRAEQERSLAKALSRYIGYTTGAYDLDRIFGILFAFVSKPSAYEIEIIESLRSHRDVSSVDQADRTTEDYLAEAIRFATSLGIVEVVSDHHTKVKRYAPTQVGRSVMGASILKNRGFYQYYRTKLVLEADADAILPVLLLSQTDDSSSARFAKYRSFHGELRKRRIEWLQKAFPDGRLLARIVNHLPWIRRRQVGLRGLVIETLSENTARHHVTPRLTWIAQLGLCTIPGGHLTRLGTRVLSSLMSSQQYFWLGPSIGVQEGLRIPDEVIRRDVTEDMLFFVESPSHPSLSSIDKLVEDTAEIMEGSYEAAKLIYAPQASLRLPIEYIAYRSYCDNTLYEWPDVLSRLFRRFRPRIERLSARKGPVGFYKVRDVMR